MLVDPITLTIFNRRLYGITEEMSLVLRKTAYSPNIKERADFSCAIFNNKGELLSQAEAIPVHLGSMPFVAKPIIELYNGKWKNGDAIIINSPRPGFGGTHLPDITLLSPIIYEEKLIYVVANRAHHADVGGMTPGSLPANSTEIFQEGLIIPPVKLFIEGEENHDVMNLILENVRTPNERRGDLRAQYSSLKLGVKRIEELIYNEKGWDFEDLGKELLNQSEVGTRKKLMEIKPGEATFIDYLDYDGINKKEHVKIACTVSIPGDGTIIFDFKGTDAERSGNCNAPFSVTHSACYYIVRLLTGEDIPTNAGCFRPVKVVAPQNSVVNPSKNVATSSANTETSSRIVDVLMGAIGKIIPWPSASQGTMNNIIIGGVLQGKPWSIYETLCGGTGASPGKNGVSAIHSHMTNTENTPIEALELSYPLIIREYAIRRDSGGKGDFTGGDGVIREIELLTKATISFQTERRRIQPWGQPNKRNNGKLGINKIIFVDNNHHHIYTEVLNTNIKDKDQYYMVDSRETIYDLIPGSRIRILTPGGGGYSRE